jgi:predicted DNA-binding transcriptional regulator AlpA
LEVILLPKKCIYTNSDQLPETMQMVHVENALGVARATAYKRVKESDFPCFQGEHGEAIRINKHAFLRFIGFMEVELTDNLKATPLIWTVEEVAEYMNICQQTAYELMRRKEAPVIQVSDRRKVTCREAWLLYIGYEPPATAKKELQATA